MAILVFQEWVHDKVIAYSHRRDKAFLDGPYNRDEEEYPRSKDVCLDSPPTSNKPTPVSLYYSLQCCVSNHHLLDIGVNELVFSLANFHLQLFEIRSLEGKSVRDNLIKSAAERPHICFCVVVFAHDDFWSDIERGANSGFRHFLCVLQHTWDSKIPYIDVFILFS